MNMTIRPITPAERKFTYAQSQQIIERTGSIGYLRADMGSSGTGFFSSWNEHCKERKTQVFKDEFDNVINALRFDCAYGGILKDRFALARYCNANPTTSYGNDREYGIRVDTARYACLMRLNPHKGEYNLYCYCYENEALDRYMRDAENGIAILNMEGKELFQIEDGEYLRIMTRSGESRDHEVRYIDNSHFELGGGFSSNIYHVAVFAKWLKDNDCTVIPIRSSLPERCYSTLLDTKMVVILKRGETGYYGTGISRSSREEAQALVDEYNGKLGVTKAQVAAMSAGSMFGWICPAADPKNYDAQGQPIRPGRKA